MWPNLDLTDDHYVSCSHHMKKKSKRIQEIAWLWYFTMTELKAVFLLYSLQLFRTREKLVKSQLDYCYQVIGIWRPSFKKLYKTNVTKTETNLFLIFLGLEKKSIKKEWKISFCF